MRCIVLISADHEWRVIRSIYPDAFINHSPYGEWFGCEWKAIKGNFYQIISTADIARSQIIFFQSGWGKIAAAGSAQFVIDQWKPDLIINLGTCGGFQGEIERGEIVLAEKTIVYDIIEQMGDFDEHIAAYATSIDLSWLKKPWPIPVRQTLLVSADRDLIAKEIPELKDRYHAVAGDWESGAIAWVTNRNHVRLLILRGVTDLVNIEGGEAYGNIEIFARATNEIMTKLNQSLPGWLQSARLF